MDEAIALTVNQTQRQALAKVPGDAAMDLPGIAVSKALAVWRDALRYQNFLRLFAQRYADVVPALRRATSADAQALTHKFKGAAGNLGLEDAAAAAHMLEQLLKLNEVPEQALLDLQAAMAIALDSIARYAAPLTSPLTRSAADHKPQVLQLPQLLAAWQSDSSSEVAQVLAEMGQALPAQSLELLQASLDGYDFRAGEALTGQLMRALPVHKEGT